MSTLAVIMLFLFVLLGLLCTTKCTRPNILLIVADDLGWNDVSFHGSGQIPTPNIDALATSGIMLQNYYVAPVCTPSRASLMTGKYAIHTGMQHKVLFATEPRGLPLSEKLLPQYFKELGYATHLVGKWHLGCYKKEYLPMNRGFDSHLGFWTGKIDMYDHTSQENGTWGFDFRRGYEVAHDLFGVYATDVYTDESIRLIKTHNKSEPLFLMVSHSAVHSGNSYEPIRAPDDLIATFTHIQDLQRQKYAAVVTKLDESVGRVVEALQAEGMLQNSIILFSTDNGGSVGEFGNNAASNFPLRGVKSTLWEGGVRGAGALWSPLLARSGRVASQRMHIADWLPTLLTAAGADVSSLQGLDGISQWEALSQDLESNRTTIVHNIDDIIGSASITVNQWKVHKGTNYNGERDSWYGPSGRDVAYDADLLYSSLTGKVLGKLGLMPSKEKVLQLRDAATVQCGNLEPIACKPLIAPCLFNVVDDPCETRNLADKEPEVLRQMLEELERVNRTAVPPGNKERDPRGDPQYWGRVVTNFGDYVSEIAQSANPTTNYYYVRAAPVWTQPL